MRTTVEKWGLAKNVQFGCRVVDAAWDDEEGKWRLSVQKTDAQGVVTSFEDSCDIFVDGSGMLK